jgi:hypothetical protein
VIVSGSETVKERDVQVDPCCAGIFLALKPEQCNYDLQEPVFVHLRVPSASPLTFASELIRPRAVPESAYDECRLHPRHRRRRDSPLAEGEAARFQWGEFRQAQQVKPLGGEFCRIPVVLIGTGHAHQIGYPLPFAAQRLLLSIGTDTRSNYGCRRPPPQSTTDAARLAGDRRRAIQVRGHPEDVHVAAADLHHEQAVQAAKRRR